MTSHRAFRFYFILYQLLASENKLFGVPLYLEVSVVMSNPSLLNLLVMCLLIWHLSQTHSQSRNSANISVTAQRNMHYKIYHGRGELSTATELYTFHATECYICFTLELMISNFTWCFTKYEINAWLIFVALSKFTTFKMIIILKILELVAFEMKTLLQHLYYHTACLRFRKGCCLHCMQQPFTSY